MRTLLLATSQSCGSVDSDAGCKRALAETHIYSKRDAFPCKRTKSVKKQILTFSSRLLMIQGTVFLSFNKSLKDEKLHKLRLCSPKDLH